MNYRHMVNLFKIGRKSENELFGIHNSEEPQGAIMSLVFLKYSSGAPQTYESLKLDSDTFKKNGGKYPASAKS